MTTRAILLAEGDVIVRNDIRAVLQEEGYDVLTAADGNEVLELSRSHEGHIDLLLSDVELPAIDGVSAYRQISSERPNIKAVFLSGYNQIVLPEELPFLRKPFEPDTVLATVKEMVEKGRTAGDLKVILVVDPDHSRQERTKGILAENGYAVFTASSAEEAETISDSITKIDLIITEVVLAGKSGAQLAEHVDASERHISTLLISHFDRNVLRDVIGFSKQPEFLPNPFTAQALLERVRLLLERQE